MCATIDETVNLAREAAADAAWRQWGLLGAPVASASPAPGAVIDPEALLLLSASIRTTERRLDDVLAWWAASGSTLLSVQRTRTMLRRFPPATAGGLAPFATAAVEAGDGRWSKLARAAANDDAGLADRGKRGGETRLIRPPALMLRLRAGFGVGVKADLLAVMLAMGGSDATVRRLSQASAYTPAAVRRAAGEMEAAGFIRQTRGRPAAYYAEPSGWATLLGIPGVTSEPPGWRSFADVFAFLARVGTWGDERRGDSAYLASSAARDLFEANRDAFELNRIPAQDPRDHPGTDFLQAFAASVRTISEWLRTSL